MNATSNHKPRHWLPYAGAVLLVGLIVAGLWPKPVLVETAPATVGPLRASVNEEGKTRIKHRYVVSAPVAGQLRRIPFKAGAEVTAGQTVVAIIDPVSPTLLDERTRASAEARRDSAAANLEKARAAYTLATNELKRFERLFAEQTISVQELDHARFREAAAAKDLAAADSALRQAEAELAAFTASVAAGVPPAVEPGVPPGGPGARMDPPSANPDLGPGGKMPPSLAGGTPAATSPCPPQAIKAPASGRILKVFEENSRVVAAGTPLVEVGDPSDLEVVVEVLSRDGAAIPPGAKVELDQWGGSEPLQARVRLVEPAAFTKVSALGVEEQRVNVVADLLTPAEQRRNVGDNFRVEARIITWEAAETLKLPVGALFRQQEDWAVFVMVEGRARLRLVKVGRSSGTETQILEGLKAGERVILYPGSRVRDGERVKTIQL